jgi:hypothetical protein
VTSIDSTFSTGLIPYSQTLNHINPVTRFPPAGFETLSPTFLEYFKQIYCFSRGSTAYKLISDSDASADARVKVFTYATVELTLSPLAMSIVPVFSTTKKSWFTSWAEGLYAITNLEDQACSFNVPYFCNQYFITNALEKEGGGSSYLHSSELEVILDSTVDGSLLSCAGDDFCLGFIRGPPPTWINISL